MTFRVECIHVLLASVKLYSSFLPDQVWFLWSLLSWGLLAFLSGIDKRIFDDVYTPLGDVWDAAVFLNSAVNFILYCTMSAQFRATFAEVICRRRPPAGSGGGQTGTAVKEVQRDTNGGMLVCWRLIFRHQTAPVSSLIHCREILSATSARPKPPTPVWVQLRPQSHGLRIWTLPIFNISWN